MRKNLHYKVLASVLAINTLNYALPADAEEYTITIDSNYTITKDYVNRKIIDYDSGTFTPFDYNGSMLLIVDDATITGNLYGQTITGTIDQDANNNTVYITNGSYINGDITGGFSERNTAHNNIVIIENSTVSEGSSIVAGAGIGFLSYKTDNTVILAGNSILKGVNLYGHNGFTGTSLGLRTDKLILVNWSGEVGSINNFRYIDFENIDITKGSTLTVTGTTDFSGDVNINSITVNEDTLAGDYAQKDGVILSSITLDDKIKDKIKNFNVKESEIGKKLKSIDLNKYYTDDNADNGIFVNKFSNIGYNTDTAYQVNFTADVDKSILTGKFIDENGTASTNSNNITDLKIDTNFDTNVATVAGIYAAGKQDATGGKLIISGNTNYDKDLYGAYAENGNAENSTVEISGDTNYKGTVYAGYSESGAVKDNTINVSKNIKANNMSLSGSNTTTAAGTLNINGNGSEFNEISNFETINFDEVALNSNAALTVTSADVDGTTININSLEGGNNYHGGESVTLLKSANAITGEGKVNIDTDIVTAGLTQDLRISTAQSADNTSIDLYVEDVSMNGQINLVAENRAVAAAFVNQGTDLISDSLDTLSRDGSYGVKTFAAVHGNRSKYDVNSDLKINGWSTIVGVGNAAEFADGDEFSWGVFYENGSGNYRTYNEFNNEFFRGDGSLVYNGGGIAARYENANGVYTEGSLRAGMLKSEMDNALRDGSGNYYGYDSESTYYGAHIGVGKIISLSESSDLDVYGKFFHTYTEGDSFTVAKDKFEFDSITSDRLRIGARVTTNKANAFSTYCGLAYEYEFNGDADMRAQNLKAPTQSLQGSSYMAEVGFNYQPTPDSPWSFDLNMRGYAGEREGASFNVQATYTF